MAQYLIRRTAILVASLLIAMLVIFFLLGMVLLSRVDVEEGQRKARAENAALVQAD